MDKLAAIHGLGCHLIAGSGREINEVVHNGHQRPPTHIQRPAIPLGKDLADGQAHARGDLFGRQLLQELAIPDEVRLSEGRAGEPTLQVRDVYLHSRYRPREEAARLVASAALDPVRPVLVIGVGELEERLRQRDSVFTGIVATIRRWAIPLFTVWALARGLLDLEPSRAVVRASRRSERLPFAQVVFG